MPSGNGGMGRGSDTRIYAPRSESNHMYSNNDEDSYRHGIGDKEEFERKRDEKIRQKEETKTVGDTPHLRIEIDKPEEDPMMGDTGSPQEEENPDMYNPEQAAAQTDMSSMPVLSVSAVQTYHKQSVHRQMALCNSSLQVNRWKMLGRR